MQGTKNVINFKWVRFRYNLYKIYLKIKNYVLKSLFGKDKMVQSMKSFNRRKKAKNR